jgi:(2Fe-2S) ferredoxin
MKQAAVRMDEKWPLSTLSPEDADEILEAIQEAEKEIEQLTFDDDPRCRAQGVKCTLRAWE